MLSITQIKKEAEKTIISQKIKEQEILKSEIEKVETLTLNKLKQILDTDFLNLFSISLKSITKNSYKLYSLLLIFESKTPKFLWFKRKKTLKVKVDLCYSEDSPSTISIDLNNHFLSSIYAVEFRKMLSLA